MKTTVAIQNIAEFEIRPSELMGEYERLVEGSAERLLPAGARSSQRNYFAPGVEPVPAFSRLGFTYVECPVTGSLFVSPRPSEDALTRYFREAESSVFWRENVLGRTGGARAEKVAGPRAEWILDGIAESRPSAARVVDVSPNGASLHAALAAAGTTFAEYRVVSPTADLDGWPSERTLTIVPGGIADLSKADGYDVAIALDALNRSYDPLALVDGLHGSLARGGLLFATAAVVGFETQALWEKSPTCLPPDKLNIPSVEGLLALFPSTRWEIIEMSTPGMFDADIVRREFEGRSGEAWPRVVRHLIGNRASADHGALQEYLQKNRLASFARLTARKL